MLEEAEAGCGVLLSEGDAFFLERSTGVLEAVELLFVKLGVLSEGHHRSPDLDRLAAGEIADERGGQVVRHTDAADAGVNAEVDWDGHLRFAGDLVQRGAQRRVDHGHDAAGDGIFEVLFVKRAEQEDGLANATVAQGDSFVEFHHGESKDFRLRLQQLGDVGHPRAVAVVLDHREDGPRGGAPRDFLHIVAQVFTVDLHPWIEGGIL